MGNKPEQVGSIVQRLSVAYQQSAALVNRKLQDIGLNLSKLSVLIHCSKDPSRYWTVSALARAIQMNQPTATKLVQALIEQDALSPQSNPDDARQKMIRLSDHGRYLIEQAQQKLNPDLLDLFFDFEVEELQFFDTTLTRLCERLEQARV